MLTEPQTLADVKVGDWVARERLTCGKWGQWISPATVSDRWVSASGVDVVLVAGRVYRLSDGLQNNLRNPVHRIRLPTPEEVAAHEAALDHEASIDLVTVEVPKGMTAAEVQHRLATWQGLRDGIADALAVLVEEIDCLGSDECRHGFRPPTDCTNTECWDRGFYRDYERARAALAAADRETP